MGALNDLSTILNAVGQLIITLGMLASSILSVWIAVQQRKHGQKLDQLMEKQNEPQ